MIGAAKAREELSSEDLEQNIAYQRNYSQYFI